MLIYSMVGSVQKNDKERVDQFKQWSLILGTQFIFICVSNSMVKILKKGSLNDHKGRLRFKGEEFL